MAFSIRVCSEVEAIGMLQDPSVSKLLSVKAEKLNKEFWPMMMGEKLLVLARPDGGNVEVHVACKFRDRAFIRETMQEGIKWLQSRGFTTIWTTAPDSRKGLVKMLESLGFHKNSEAGTWELKQH